MASFPTSVKTFTTLVDNVDSILAAHQNERGDEITAIETWLLAGNAGAKGVCDGRLTLTSGTPVTTANVTGAGTIYFAPYSGNQIGLYDGSASWSILTFTETSLALGTMTSGLPYDVFAYNNSGTVALEKTAWTNGTTRATALTTQDGVYVRSGATTRRYLGTFYTTSTTATEDSRTKRFLWNYYNRQWRELLVADSTNSWVYSTATWRSANNSTANRVEFVQGLDENPIFAEVAGSTTADAAGYYLLFGMALDATNTNDCATDGVTYLATTGAANQVVPTYGRYTKYVGIGYHYLQWTEISSGTATTTAYSKSGALRQSGIVGRVMG
jgi:hypothetical protein